MADTKQCGGDCLKCSLQQQIYCTSQRCFVLAQNQETIIALLNEIRQSLTGEALINPFQENTQEGRGGENSSPEENNT